MVKTNSQDLEKLLKKLNYDNWEEHAAEVAHAYFPIGSLVNYYYANINFGIVKSISDTGRITVQNGEMPHIKTTDNNPVYAKIWYSADILKFVPITEEEVKRGWKKHTTIFNPKYLDLHQDLKTTQIYSPINYGQVRGNRSLSLSKPKIVTKWKKDLIMYESYCD